MKKQIIVLLSWVLSLIIPTNALAHFGMLIPSDSMVMQDENRVISITLSFSHPFEGKGMGMIKPQRFSVVMGGKEDKLIGLLKETRTLGRKAWVMNYKIRRPGVYTFYMEPKPYFEQAEDSFIIHYTKVFVAAFGFEDGWDKPLGLKTEIIPITRPFGLYAGNVFQGIVTLDGNPIPHARVEVEFYNEAGKAKAPTEYMITQVIKSDKNGVFTYAVPGAGWWGFAALNQSGQKMKYKGQDKNVELGAVIWVKFHEWQTEGR